MKKRFFGKLVLFGGAIYVICLVLFFRVQKVFNTKVVVCDKVNWMHGIHHKAYDFATLGSSRAINTFNNRIVDDSLGTHSINIGTSGGGYAENYINLYQFLKNGNSVKTVL